MADNMMTRGATWLAGKTKDHAGRSVTYYQGSGSVALTGTLNLNNYDVADMEGFATRIRFFDWTFETADLVIDSAAIEPRRGDYIEETVDGSTRRYEVNPISETEPASRPFDPAGMITLVHTKRTA